MDLIDQVQLMVRKIEFMEEQRDFDKKTKEEREAVERVEGRPRPLPAGTLLADALRAHRGTRLQQSSWPVPRRQATP